MHHVSTTPTASVLFGVIVACSIAISCSRRNPDYVDTQGARGSGGSSTSGAMPGLTSPGSTGGMSAASSPGPTGPELDGGSETSGDDKGSSESQGETESPLPDEPSPCCEPDGACLLDPKIADCTCAYSPDCCDGVWGPGCVVLAIDLCDLSCPVDCCIPHEVGGCYDDEVVETVCYDPILGDPNCCDVAWDPYCAYRAIVEHDLCLSENPCCEPGEAPGCDNETTVACVCAVDPWCCLVDWDQECVAQASSCGECP